MMAATRTKRQRRLRNGRDLTFDSVQECEAFADWNFCRKSGAQRGRTNQAYYQYI